MSDQYSTAVKSSLKLKGKGAQAAGIQKKKKKSKSSSTATTEESSNGEMGNHSHITSRKSHQSESSRPVIAKTKAELQFQQMQGKQQMDRILKKADKTHKQRVEDFNKHLDSLSEHYDIPKVSWTK